MYFKTYENGYFRKLTKKGKRKAENLPSRYNFYQLKDWEILNPDAQWEDCVCEDSSFLLPILKKKQVIIVLDSYIKS